MHPFIAALPPEVIDGLRSGRLLLDWSQARLACEAGISSSTVCAVDTAPAHG